MRTQKKNTVNKGQTIEQIVQRKLVEVNPIVAKIDWTKLVERKL